LSNQRRPPAPPPAKPSHADRRARGRIVLEYGPDSTGEDAWYPLSKHRISTAATGERAHDFDKYLIDCLPHGQILNLGAGIGLQGVGRHIVNVDHVRPRVTTNSTFVLADAADLPFRDEVFDGALLKDILEHVALPIAVTSETARVLRKAAKLIVEVPRALPRAVWDDPTHIRGFTARALSTTLCLSGLTPTTPRRIGGLPGAGRLRLTPWLILIMRIPGLGHWYGTNWLVRAQRDGGDQSDQLQSKASPVQ
jgi:SAM-dependent methyltransferase